MIGQLWAGAQRRHLFWLQSFIPDAQISQVSKKRLREIPTKSILVLAQYKYPVSVDIFNISPSFPFLWISHYPVHVNGPKSIARAPRDANMVPVSINGQLGFVAMMLSLNEKR